MLPVLVLLTTLLSVPGDPGPDRDGLSATAWELTAIVYAAAVYRIPIDLAIGLSAHESRITSRARSIERDGGVRDIGLFQLSSLYIPYFAYLAGIENPNPYNPIHNSLMAMAYLRNLLNNTPCENSAILSYNLGLARYRRVCGVVDPGKSVYVQGVRKWVATAKSKGIRISGVL